MRGFLHRYNNVITIAVIAFDMRYKKYIYTYIKLYRKYNFIWRWHIINRPFVHILYADVLEPT